MNYWQDGSASPAIRPTYTSNIVVQHNKIGCITFGSASVFVNIIERLFSLFSKMRKGRELAGKKKKTLCSLLCDSRNVQCIDFLSGGFSVYFYGGTINQHLVSSKKKCLFEKKKKCYLIFASLLPTLAENENE